MPISEKTILQRSKSIISNEIDGETVMMDSAFSDYYGLKEVGTHIWRLLENELSVQNICEALTSKYDVSYQQFLEDMLPFLEALRKSKWSRFMINFQRPYVRKRWTFQKRFVISINFQEIAIFGC